MNNSIISIDLENNLKTLLGSVKIDLEDSKGRMYRKEIDLYKILKDEDNKKFDIVIFSTDFLDSVK